MEITIMIAGFIAIVFFSVAGIWALRLKKKTHSLPESTGRSYSSGGGSTSGADTTSGLGFAAAMHEYRHHSNDSGSDSSSSSHHYSSDSGSDSSSSSCD